MRMALLLVLLITIACAKQTGTGAGICPTLPASVTCTQEMGFVDVSACGADFHLVNNVTYICGGCTAISQTDNSQYVQAANGTFTFPQGGPKGTSCSFTVTNGTLTANFN